MGPLRIADPPLSIAFARFPQIDHGSVAFQNLLAKSSRFKIGSTYSSGVPLATPQIGWGVLLATSLTQSVAMLATSQVQLVAPLELDWCREGYQRDH